MAKLSRRRFLQLGLAGAATITLQNKLAEFIKATELVEGGTNVSRTTGFARRGTPTVCYQCQARCGIIGFTEEARLVKIEGNPKDLNNRGRICAKGQAGINYVYNPDRLLYPIKRVGPRGQGKWQRIDWDEAITEVAAALRSIRSSGDPNQLLFFVGFEGASNITNRFTNAYGTSSVFLEQAPSRANKWIAQQLTWGASYDIADAANSKYILNFGANPYETHAHFVPLIQRIIDGRMNGARLITFDPRLSHTAGKSDRWYPIRPGTDGIVALAMANVIIQRGLYDKDFVENWLNYRLDQLKEYLAEFTPERAQEESGIDASEILRTAVEFGLTKPAVAIAGGGIASHSNGVQTERAIALLNAITGNIDTRGGSCLPRVYEFAEPSPQPPPPPKISKIVRPDGFPLASYGAPQKVASLIKDGVQKVSAIVFCQANPVFTFPESEIAITVLKDEKLVPFIVAIDSYITETAALADLVLPAATYLESWALESPPTYHLVHQVSLRQPVIKPVGESMPVHDILIQVANEIGDGMEKYFSFGTMENFLEAAIAKLEPLTRAGGLDYLKANGVWIDPAASITYRSFEKGGFHTPSRKFEVYSKQMEINGFSPLPTYEKPQSGGSESAFTMLVVQCAVHNDSTTATSIWLNEIVHDNPVLINAEVAKQMGIKRGDKVRVTSTIGSIVAKAWPTQGLIPNVVAIGNHCGHWEYGRIAQSKQFESSDPNTKLIWWAKHGNGAHVQSIVPMITDPIGGGQAWSETTVTISKV